MRSSILDDPVEGYLGICWHQRFVKQGRNIVGPIVLAKKTLRLKRT